MSTTIKWSLNITVTGGPRLVPSGTIDIESYEVIDVDVATGASATLALNALDEASFLVITSNAYDAADLTYAIGGGSAVPFTSPILLFSAAEIALLGNPLPDTIEVENNIPDTTVKVAALIGRDATP